MIQFATMAANTALAVQATAKRTAINFHDGFIFIFHFPLRVLAEEASRLRA
jgi:hypothetical protein